jgi:parallel beta-helix repeat protein
MRTILAILGLVLSCTAGGFAQPLGPQTYYVSPDGHDDGAGLPNTPLLTLQAAAHQARPGDTVIARPGEYAGFVLGWDDGQRGRTGAPIKFIGQPGAVIVSRNSKTRDGIDLEPGCDDIVIQGFTVNNSSESIDRAGIRVSGSNHVSVIGNTVSGCGTWGIFTSHSSDLLIQDNTTSGSQKQHGIYVSNSADHARIRGNIVFGNRGSGIHLNGDLSQGDNGLITSALIENNIIHDNGAGGGSGINCDGVQNSIIRCNLLYANRGSGISLFHEDGAAGSTGNLVVNNTIVMAPAARFAINVNSQSTGNVIFNNILLDPNPLAGSIKVTPDSRDGLVSDYNIVEDRFSPDGDERCGLRDWQSNTAQDKHSRVASTTEIFLNVGGNDFHLFPSSVAAHGGVAGLSGRNAPQVDLQGNVFGPAWDIGAYRLVPAPVTAR